MENEFDQAGLEFSNEAFIDTVRLWTTGLGLVLLCLWLPSGPEVAGLLVGMVVSTFLIVRLWSRLMEVGREPGLLRVWLTNKRWWTYITYKIFGVF